MSVGAKSLRAPIRPRIVRGRRSITLMGFARPAFIALALLMVWDLPLAFVGIPQYQSVQVQVVLLAGPVLLGLAQTVLVGRPDRLGYTMLAFVGWAFFVSALSNVFFIPQPFGGWLPGLVYVIPLLLLYAGRLLRMSVRDALDGLIIAAVIGSLLAIVDRITPLTALDAFIHFSDYRATERRLVLMHNESALALIVAVARLLDWRDLRRTVVYAGIAAVLAFNLVVLAETRLTVAAALIALGAYVVLVERGSRRLGFVIAGGVLALTVVPIVLQSYIEQIFVTGLSEDNSLFYRNLEIEHFRRYFEQTHGIGFGLMSLSPNKPNILSNALYYDASIYGFKGAQMALNDVRIYAALYQFGYVGLLFVLYLTAYSVWALLGIARRRMHPRARELGAFGLVVAAFMISPLPINWFTVDNTITLGGLIWLIVDRAVAESRVVHRYIRGAVQPGADLSKVSRSST